MSRYFAPISLEDFKLKIKSFMYEDEYSWPNNLIKKVGNDIKVDFDLENVSTGMTKDDFGPEGLMGFQTLPNGMTFFGMAAGGDGQHWVYFIFYFDGKKIRGYVPTEGNPWNTTTKQAYGNDEVADGKNAKKRWPEIYDGLPVESFDFEADSEEIKKDILSRILPNETKQKETPKSIIESLIFYGIGDEAYELFVETCNFSRSLCGMGEDKKALLVAKWAKEMADYSLKLAKENNEDLNYNAKGVWG